MKVQRSTSWEKATTVREARETLRGRAHSAPPRNVLRGAGPASGPAGGNHPLNLNSLAGTAPSKHPGPWLLRTDLSLHCFTVRVMLWPYRLSKV